MKAIDLLKINERDDVRRTPPRIDEIVLAYAFLDGLTQDCAGREIADETSFSIEDQLIAMIDGDSETSGSEECYYCEDDDRENLEEEILEAVIEQDSARSESNDEAIAHMAHSDEPSPPRTHGQARREPWLLSHADLLDARAKPDTKRQNRRIIRTRDTIRQSA